jgi:hypothetical protein
MLTFFESLITKNFVAIVFSKNGVFPRLEKLFLYADFQLVFLTFFLLFFHIQRKSFHVIECLIRL